MPSAPCHLRKLPIALRGFAVLTALTLVGVSAALAEEKIKILFLPPPMEGTLSLGIYNEAGALVRTLHEEAGTDEFIAAFNGLITHWDGRDDQDALCPPGKYRARGYMVGDLEVEGIDYHGNDWYLDDDSPRISRITRIAGLEGDRLLLEALQPGSDSPALFIASPATQATSKALGTPKEPEPADSDGAAPDDQEESQQESAQTWKAVPAPEGTPFPLAPLFAKTDTPAFASMKPLSQPGESTVAPDGAIWGIDGAVVKEFSAEGKLERELHSIDEQLTPTGITATEALLFVLGESPTEQRLRGLPYNSPGEALVDAGITFTPALEQALPLLSFPDGSAFAPQDEIKVPLIANPLLKNAKAGSLSLKLTLKPTGTHLSTADGLPLIPISTTPHLRWAAAGQQPGAKTITLFESDGAVVAEYRISAPGSIMAFDAGTYKIKAPKPPEPPKSSESPPAPEPISDDEPEFTPVIQPASTPEPATSPSETPITGKNPIIE